MQIFKIIELYIFHPVQWAVKNWSKCNLMSPSFENVLQFSFVNLERNGNQIVSMVLIYLNSVCFSFDCFIKLNGLWGFSQRLQNNKLVTCSFLDATVCNLDHHTMKNLCKYCSIIALIWSLSISEGPP